MKKANILIVEDSSIDAEIIVRQIEQSGFKLNWDRIFTAEDLSKEMEKRNWDLVISDFEMGEFNGIEALKIVRSMQPNLPFIMVSGVVGEEVAVEAMKLGANDYVMKENLARLAPAVERELEESRKKKQLHYELDAAEQRLKTLAHITNDAIMLINEKRQIYFWNPAAERIYGYKADEILNKDYMYFIVPKALQQEYAKRFDDFQKTGHDAALNKPFEFLAVKKDGTEFFTEVTFSAFKVNDHCHLAGISRDIAARKRNEQKMKNLLSENETFLKEIFHRVKNNFQLIHSLMSLQINRLDDQKLIEILNESKNRIHSMSIIHQKLYQSKNLKHFDFSDYLNTLVYQLYRTYCTDFDKISLKLDIDKVILSIDQAIPCGLIVNELVTNSLKYGFPGLLNIEGEISVRLKQKSDKTVELMVSDNGVGIPENINLEKPVSLGLELVTMLSKEQLNGDLQLDGKSGTKFVIRFKKK